MDAGFLWGCRSGTQERRRKWVKQERPLEEQVGQDKEVIAQQGAPCIESQMMDLHIKISDFETEV